MTHNAVSDRLIDQRLRNRIWEIVEILAEGAQGIRTVGHAEYFESFYDYIPHRDDGKMRKLSTLNDDEISVLGSLSAIIDDACDATPSIMNEDEFISSGWPERIRVMAESVLAVFMLRGKFSEELEQDEPS